MTLEMPQEMSEKFAIRNATITLEMTQERLSLFDKCLTSVWTIRMALEMTSVIMRETLEKFDKKTTFKVTFEMTFEMTL
jgi:hypothetical protein